MSTLEEFLSSVLKHAAPKYYDPVKAHEYYMRTRELKGRRTGSGLTDNQKKAFDYSKSQIEEAEDKDVDAASVQKKQQLESVRQAAEKKRGEIREKLKALLEQATQRKEERLAEIDAERETNLARISDTLKEDLKAISDKQKRDLQRVADKKRQELLDITEDTKRQIDALPEIPAGIPKEKAAEMAAERSAKIEKLRGDATQKKQGVADKYDTERDGIREAIQVEKDQVRDEATEARETVRNQAAEKRAAISNETTNQKNLQRDESGSERQKLTAQVKEVVSAAQESYNKLKQELKAKYEGELDTEYEAIKRTVR